MWATDEFGRTAQERRELLNWAMTVASESDLDDARELGRLIGVARFTKAGQS